MSDGEKPWREAAERFHYWMTWVSSLVGSVAVGVSAITLIEGDPERAAGIAACGFVLNYWGAREAREQERRDQERRRNG